MSSPFCQPCHDHLHYKGCLPKRCQEKGCHNFEPLVLGTKRKLKGIVGYR